ncbi:LuxR C-terminal-related transcriptional regulator [Nonomuraea gerenzanensis]|nr:LuxR C-terminal-related transcriptional regulator [Nonomuraea gerenzanensis]
MTADCERGTDRSPLSLREGEVPRLSAAEAQPAEIAERLFLTCGTVRDCLASAMTKPGARNRVRAGRLRPCTPSPSSRSTG